MLLYTIALGGRYGTSGVLALGIIGKTPIEVLFVVGFVVCV
jgi:hypothetical protein